MVQDVTKLPTGLVTFILTDIEGSTRLWEHDPVAMESAVLAHNDLIALEVANSGGVLLREKGEGDGTFSVFNDAAGAVAAAARIQLGLDESRAGIKLAARIGIHSGDVSLMPDGDYSAPVINRCARIRGLAAGGQTLLSGQTAVLVRDALPDGISLADLGTHRLRDLSRPERIFQLSPQGIPNEFPPIASLDSLPHNLPVQLTSFFGRENELAAIHGLLQDRRLVTITGVGGLGKTRVALQVAADELDSYPGGVWFVALDKITDPRLVPDRIAAALKVREQADRPILDTVAAALKAGASLLVMDNCEHVLSVACVVISELLARCPSLKVLATSRERLHIPGESVVALSSLGAASCVELFAERAGRFRQDFELSQKNASELAEICDTLDGIPLAIELAAARASILTPAQIVDHLKDRFGFLKSPRSTQPRHRTLESAVNWSYGLLSEAEQVAFRRLSVFAGGFRFSAAANVAVDTDAVDILTGLVDKSLVTSDESEPPRFEMLETVRSYAARKLAGSGEEPEVRGRHLSWVIETVCALEPRGPGQQHVLSAMSLEQDNVRAALDWAHLAGLTEELSGLTSCMWHFWLVRGFWTEGRQWLEKALAGLGEPVTRAKLLVGAGGLAQCQGDFEMAQQKLEEAIDLFGEIQDRTGGAAARQVLAQVYMGRGNFEKTSVLINQALPILREAGESEDLSDALNTMGYIAQQKGELGDALKCFEEALIIARQTRDPQRISRALLYLAGAADSQQDFESSRKWLAEAVASLQASGNLSLLAHTELRLGRAAKAAGDYAVASRHFEEAVKGAEGLGEQGLAAYACLEMANLARISGDEKAAVVVNKALVAMRSLGDRRGLIYALLEAAALDGETRLAEAKTIATELGDQQAIADCKKAAEDLGLV